MITVRELSFRRRPSPDCVSQTIVSKFGFFTSSDAKLDPFYRQFSDGKITNDSAEGFS